LSLRLFAFRARDTETVGGGACEKTSSGLREGRHRWVSKNSLV
jgi:hypothetical protein